MGLKGRFNVFLAFFVFGFFLSSAGFAISPRSSVLVNTNLTDDARGIAVASDGELSAICWNEGGSTNQVFVATSDGRGLAWSSPIRVDADAFTKITQIDSLFVVGDNLYVVWEANSSLSFARSIDRGASFSSPTPLDAGPGNVRDWRVAVSPDPSGDHLYVLSSTAVGDEDLYLTASHDDGATFSTAVLVPSVGTTGDVDALAISADGLVAHIVWDDNRSGRDSVYYQKTTDGGSTFLLSDLSLGDNVGVEDSQDPLSIASRGSTVAVFWNEEPMGTGNEVVIVNTSVDGGATFQGGVTVGDYTPGTDDTDEGAIGIDPCTNHIIAVWEDDRTGSDQAYGVISSDFGVSFGSDVQLSVNGAEKPLVLTSTAGFGDVVVLWESTGVPRTLEAAHSRDGGAQFSSAVTVSDNPGFVDFPTGAENSLYRNFIHGWASLEGSSLKLYAGGFRPQALLPVGSFTPGGNASFDVSGFSLAENGFSFGVLISASPGSFTLPLGDGRNTGLAADSFFARSTAQIPGILSGSIDLLGTGSTAQFRIPGSVSPGTTLHCVALAFQLGGGGPTIGNLTDRIAVVVE